MLATAARQNPLDVEGQRTEDAPVYILVAGGARLFVDSNGNLSCQTAANRTLDPALTLVAHPPGVLLCVFLQALDSEEDRRKPLVHAFVVQNEDDPAKDGVEGTKETTYVSQEVQQGVGRPDVDIPI